MISFNMVAEHYIFLISLAVCLPFLITYSVTFVRGSNPYRQMVKDCRPPLAPYWTPVLGLGLSFFWNTGVVGDLSK